MATRTSPARFCSCTLQAYAGLVSWSNCKLLLSDLLGRRLLGGSLLGRGLGSGLLHGRGSLLGLLGQLDADQLGGALSDGAGLAGHGAQRVLRQLDGLIGHALDAACGLFDGGLATKARQRLFA